MGASSLQKLSDLHFYVSGQVTIHPDATIASDVLLQADPGSHLIIGSRASIGPGSILHAVQGTLEIGSDVTTGTRVLIVGSGMVRAGACIGAFSTLMFQIAVQQHGVIPPHSLIGDESRKVDFGSGDAVDSSSDTAAGGNGEVNAEMNGAVQGGDRPSTDNDSSVNGSGDRHAVQEDAVQEDDRNETPNPHPNTPSVPTSVVYGKASVERLIKVMFPARGYDFNGTHANGTHANGTHANGTHGDDNHANGTHADDNGGRSP